ncbi:MAG: DUF6266 family protein [Candidatus Pedobacter colombiensis]|uniref:DUF6266 family protein n=1 Tax=Candidatus Pedobacter colombiensis TaxID=3121371 RepID=A0AAJ5W9F5_9SPHI|nr:DUF6266 family protein [Pedobacter sp.]WEK20349.1 MAG: DUF6266 family protein [Pedobacter sp.]
MAILKNGIMGGVKGKLGNLVGYILNDQEVLRTIGINDKPLTNKQLNNKLQMKVIMEFLRSMDSLLETGFNPKAAGTKKNYHNLAVSYNKPHALKGFYPDVEVDYPKVVISIGDLPQPINPTVEFVTEGLKFSWDGAGISWPYSIDQVMLLAYAPESKTCAFKNSGARRMKGYDILEITPQMHYEPLEVYISFVSDDRKRAANSLYLGRIMNL